MYEVTHPEETFLPPSHSNQNIQEIDERQHANNSKLLRTAVDYRYVQRLVKQLLTVLCVPHVYVPTWYVGKQEGRSIIHHVLIAVVTYLGNRRLQRQRQLQKSRN